MENRWDRGGMRGEEDGIGEINLALDREDPAHGLNPKQPRASSSSSLIADLDSRYEAVWKDQDAGEGRRALRHTDHDVDWASVHGLTVRLGILATSATISNHLKHTRACYVYIYINYINYTIYNIYNISIWNIYN